MSNRLYFASVDPTGTTVTIPHYAASIQWPTREQIKYKPTLDGKINIQRRITDDREIKLIFESVKEREEILTGVIDAGISTTSFKTDLGVSGDNYIDDTFNGYYIKLDTDEEQLISATGGFVAVDGVITVDSAFSPAPTSGTLPYTAWHHGSTH